MKKRIIVLSMIGLAAVALYYFFFLEENAMEQIIVKPSYGEFEIVVKTTGELRAQKSIEIRGPSEVQNLGIYNMKITNLVDEGTHVKEGDFVAELDKSDLTSKMKELDLNIQKLESQYKQKKLDSTITLSQARDNLENTKYSLEEKKLLMEQSKYEPPATIRQAEIAYEKELRNYKQQKKNYSTKVEQALTELSIVGADLEKERQKLQALSELQQQFTILAPSDGMVIYARDWGNRRKVVGSSITPWNSTVANLPDLTTMESITYVNELDIQKIKTGLEAIISLDANPDKKLTGKLTKVANIGEDLEGRDTKVFEVIIEINESDTTLLPSMTTSNQIIVDRFEDVLSIPLDALQTQVNEDVKIQYVFKKSGGSFIKQEVRTGKMNEDMIIIEEGLKQEDDILLTVPEDYEDLDFMLIEDRSAKAKIEQEKK